MNATTVDKEKSILVGEINRDLQSMNPMILRRVKDITYGMCVKHEAKDEPEPDKPKAS